MPRIALTLAILSCLLAASSARAEGEIIGDRYSISTELIALEPQLSLDARGELGYGASLRIITYEWTHFFWTIFEVGHGITGEGLYTYIGSRPGLPVRFGENDAQQLRFGLGFDYTAAFLDRPGSESAFGAGLFLSPSVHYIYQTTGSFFLSAGVSAFLFAAGVRKGYPFFLLASVGFGFSV